MGTQTTVPCAQADDSGLLDLLQSPNWVKVYVVSTVDPGFDSRLRRNFSGSRHIGDLNTGVPVATLPGAWRYRSALELVDPVSEYCEWVR